MKTILENYINGNLTDAKKGARRFSLSKLAAYVAENYINDFTAALAVAEFLKGKASFDRACQAEHKAHKLEKAAQDLFGQSYRSLPDDGAKMDAAATLAGV